MKKVLAIFLITFLFQTGNIFGQHAKNFKDQVIRSGYKSKKPKMRKAIRRIRKLHPSVKNKANHTVSEFVKLTNEHYLPYSNKDVTGLPQSSQTPILTAHGYINDYQTYNSDLGYPSSFLINATSLKNYFLDPESRGADNNYYLQIYLGYNPNANNQLTVVFTGVVVDGNGNRKHFYHIPGIVYANSVACPACGVVPDMLDGVQNVNLPWNTYNQDCATDVAIAKNWISNYQDWTIDNGYPQSMLMYANDLKTFLTTMNVPYLQIYLGYKDTNTNLTFIIVGVDNNGRHIYYNNNVLEECAPCPICNIMADAIDDNPQFIER